jgi:type II secretion system protein G
MMVVVMIIGLLAAIVVPNLLRNKDRASQKKVVADIIALEGALDLYYLDSNRYPDNDQRLNALAASTAHEGGYLKCIPRAPGIGHTTSVHWAFMEKSIFLPSLKITGKRGKAQWRI